MHSMRSMEVRDYISPYFPGLRKIVEIETGKIIDFFVFDIYQR